MKKWKILVAMVGAMAAAVWCGSLIRDRAMLDSGLIRLHVVAASDSEEDQALKLQVRDAVIEELSDKMGEVRNVDDARAFLGEHLADIQASAERTLQSAGCEDTVTVSLQKETFDTRHYDTFTLPAGVYESLRITIGDGDGHNWWCVVFPTLCVSATSEAFEDTAVEAGMSDSLTGAISNEEGYEIRFFILDVLGRLENIWFEG